MWRISVVMLVTAVFAGLLIYDPYDPSSVSAATPINWPPRPASGVPTLAQAETVPAAEAPPTITPQDVEGIVLKILADRKGPQERAPSRDPSEVVGALPDKPVGTVALRPLPASNGLQEQPVLQSTTPSGQPVSGRREDPSEARVDVATKSAVTASRPSPMSNGPQERPVQHSAALTPAVQPISGRREDPSMSRVDVPIAVGGVCASGEVIGLDPNGDNFLSVRSGPGGQPYHEIDRLFSSNAVHVCGRKAAWLAVVYSTGRRAQDSCYISSYGTQRSYEGPCQYGWVHSRYIKMATSK